MIYIELVVTAISTIKQKQGQKKKEKNKINKIVNTNACTCIVFIIPPKGFICILMIEEAKQNNLFFAERNQYINNLIMDIAFSEFET